jgi:hypothetical protein
MGKVSRNYDRLGALPTHRSGLPARDEEQALREERRQRKLDNLCEAYAEQRAEDNPPIEPKPATGERLQVELDLEESA